MNAAICKTAAVSIGAWVAAVVLSLVMSAPAMASGSEHPPIDGRRSTPTVLIHETPGVPGGDYDGSASWAYGFRTYPQHYWGIFAWGNTRAALTLGRLQSGDTVSFAGEVGGVFAVDPSAATPDAVAHVPDGNGALRDVRLVRMS